MTGRTSRVHVTGVIEFHVETAELGKLFQRGRRGIAVAVGANRVRGISELLYVTTGARQVIFPTGQRGASRISFASMTKRARQSRVVRRGVLKL